MVYDHGFEKHSRNEGYDTPYQGDRSMYLPCRIFGMKRAVSSITGCKSISELCLIILPTHGIKISSR
jgi:hypothetical protein